MDNGLELALYGMGTVFLFLTLLVMAVTAMSRIVLAMDSGTVRPAGTNQPMDHAFDSDGFDSERLNLEREAIVVISAAIARYRADHE